MIGECPLYRSREDDDLLLYHLHHQWCFTQGLLEDVHNSDPVIYADDGGVLEVSEVGDLRGWRVAVFNGGRTMEVRVLPRIKVCV